MPEQPDNIVPITRNARSAAEKFSAEHDSELLTILFTDLVDSTKLQSDLGNVEAARLTEVHRKIVRDELAKYDDAREIEWAGDSCLAVFTKPSDAVLFALRMQSKHRTARETEARLPLVRVGMHLGEIVVKRRDDGGKKTEDLFGLQVSEAARVMSVARGNQIYCTRAVFDNARGALKGSAIEGIGDVIWVNYGAYMLKGSEDAVELCEVGSSEVAVLKAPQPSDKVSPLLPDGAQLYHPIVPSEGVPQPARRIPLWAFGIAVAVALVVGGLVGRSAPNTTPLSDGGTAPAPESKPLVRLSINLDPSQPAAQAGAGGGIALSPDGSLLVYTTGVVPNSQLVLRKMDQLDASTIPGTEGGIYPVFSPDGEWIAYTDLLDAKFKKVSVRGGAPVTLCDYPNGAPFLSWGDDGYIYFSAGEDGISRVAKAGGETEKLTSSGDGELFHVSPHALPGGRFVLFTIVKNFSGEGMAIAAYSLGSGETTTILEGAWNAKYVPTGHLVYEIQGGLMAAPFDSDRLEFAGPAVPVGEDRMVKFDVVVPAEFAISASGSFAHIVGSGDAANFFQRLYSLVWVDRNGNETLLDFPPKNFDSPRLSPDGRYLAVSRRDFDTDNFDPTVGTDIWVYDLERNTRWRLTFDHAFETFPVWTPDGTRVVYRSDQQRGVFSLKWKSADGTDAAERLATNSSVPLENTYPYAWTPDGQGLVIGESDGGNKVDLFLISPESGEEARKLTESSFREWRARVSPDGRWIAYASDFSNQNEVYVQSFPEMAGKWQISTEGGMDPIWSPDGTELFYRNGEAVMAVPVETGRVFRAGTPKVLFEGKYRGFDSTIRPSYDLAPDGERFLMLKPVEEEETGQGSTEIVVILNWLENLKRLAPVPEAN